VNPAQAPAPGVATVALYIDGRWTGSADGAGMDAVSPSTGEVIGRVAWGTREDVDRVVLAADQVGERRDQLARCSPSTRASHC
jgi:acyl-CoA reductase-like NAD-dependent aldehyde dehydrogenase